MFAFSKQDTFKFNWFSLTFLASRLFWWLQDISTLNFSTPSFNPGLFIPRLSTLDSRVGTFLRTGFLAPVAVEPGLGWKLWIWSLGLKSSGLKCSATFFWRQNYFFVGAPNICHLFLRSVMVLPIFGPYKNILMSIARLNLKIDLNNVLAGNLKFLCLLIFYVK